MAYKLQEQKILPNGLNLLAPSDQVTEGDCIDLGDWWSGAAGRLEQAPTEVQVNSGSVYTAQDSICQVTGSSSRIYYGGGGYLRQIGRAADAPIVAGLDGAPLGLLSYQGYVWVMNRQVTVTTPYLGKGQCKDDGTTVTDWSPAPPGVPTLQDGGVNGAALSPAVHNPPEVGGLPAKQISYYVTWQLGTLGETNPSTVSGVITPATITPAVDGSIVRITQPTPPANATGWNIYRKSLLTGTVYRLNEFTLDITRTYVDDYGDDVHTHSDNQLLSLGIIMEGDHDPAPPCRVIADQTYNGRILVANSAANPNRLWYTPALQPAFFRGAANPNAGDWVDIGTDAGDEILVMTVRPGIVVIYRAHSIWRHVGDLGDPNARVECVVPNLGTVGVRGAVATSLGDYFIWNDGVYRFNNDWAQKVSQKVEPVFRGLSTESLVTLGTSYRSKCAVGYKNGRVWVSYPPTSGALGGASLVYHVDSQRWFNCSAAFLDFCDTGTAFLGAGPGIFSLESSYAGASALTFQSEYQDCGLPDHEKTWGDLVLNHNTQGQTLTILIRTNKKATSNDTFTLTTINSSALTKQIIPLVYPSGYTVTALRGKPIRAYNLSVRITGTGASAAPPVIIDTPMLLHYYVEARQGKTFDTGITSHGLEGVGTIDEVELDVDTSAGTATLVISSDIPGGVMADRTSGGITVAQTTGRQVLRLVLATPIDGRRFRHQMSTTTGFQVYGYRVRVLPIGVYLDGAQSEVWQTGSLVTGV
jgi:hypothetical protein